MKPVFFIVTLYLCFISCENKSEIEIRENCLSDANFSNTALFEGTFIVCFTEPLIQESLLGSVLVEKESDKECKLSLKSIDSSIDTSFIVEFECLPFDSLESSGLFLEFFMEEERNGGSISAIGDEF